MAVSIYFAIRQIIDRTKLQKCQLKLHHFPTRCVNKPDKQ